MEPMITLPPEERARRRPALIFGDDGQEGSKRVFKELFKVLLAEVHRGYCSRIEITLFRDGVINMTTNGRGFYVGEDDQRWKDIFAALPFKHYSDVPQSDFAFSLYEESGLTSKEERGFYDELSLVCIQSVCQHMCCMIFGDGRKHDLCFENGVPKSRVSSACDPKKHGMSFSFLIDPTVFHSQHILPLDDVINIARTAAIRFPGLLVLVKTEKSGGWITHRFGREGEAGSKR